jgi:GT2 family glycosyltransferase
MTDMTVVIPNWNGKELLSSVCLPSLAKQTYTDFSVTVVDNGSTDGSIELVRTEHPDVTVIEVGHNSGFAAAVNRGIAAASSPFIVLLNNDVELAPRWMEEMVRAAEAHPAAGSLACRMMDFDDRELIFAAGDAVTVGGPIFQRGHRERDVGHFDHLEPVLCPCAGAALYRRDALEAVGPFDEDFFAYYEDVDWGLRAQLLGFQSWYVPTAAAYHVGGATSSKVSGMRSALLMRNLYWLVLKSFPAEVVLRNLPRLSFRIVRRYYGVFREGRRRETVGVALQAIRLTPRMLRKRRDIYARRQVGSAELAALLTDDPPLRSGIIDRLRRPLRP